MSSLPDWQPVHDYWFPAGIDASGARHREMIMWWFGGGANAGLKPFAPLVAAAKARRLDAWRTAAKSHLALILVLDQFTRGLFAGTPGAYAGDPLALEIAEEGLGNGHYDMLAHPWEKTFFFLPLGHTEGPSHAERLRRVAALAERIARGARSLAAALRAVDEPGARESRADAALRPLPASQRHARPRLDRRGAGLRR